MINLIKQRTIGLIALSLACFILSTNTSFAYIDPGSGSMVLQVLIASILGILTAIKLYWSKIKSYFSKSSDASKSEESEQ